MLCERGREYREMAREMRIIDNYDAAGSLDGKASGFFAAARMVRDNFPELGSVPRKPAAPPAPDPRREALEKAFNAEAGGPWPGKDEWVKHHVEIAISAIDSLKGSAE
jgi:hypothetical protein